MANKISLLLLALIFCATAGSEPQSLKELETQLREKPDQIQIREQTARAYLKEKNFKRVVELLNPYTDIATPRGFLNLASAYQELKDYNQLVRVLGLLADKRPQDAEVRYLLGNAHLKYSSSLADPMAQKKSESLAIEKFREAVQIKRRFAVAHQALLQYFLNSKLNHEAREQALDMLKIFGDHGELYSHLCRLYAIEGFLAQANASCQKAMQLSPNLAEPFLYLAQVFYDQKQMDRAEKLLFQAAKNFPESEFAQYGAGQYFINNGNFPVAAKYLARAVAKDPTSARSQLAYATALFGADRAEEALDHYVQACRLNPTVQEIFLLAATRLRLKDSRHDLAQRYAQAAGACTK